MNMHECIRPESVGDLLQGSPDDPVRLEAQACPHCRVLIHSFREFEDAEIAPGSRPDEATAVLGALLEGAAEPAVVRAMPPRRSWRPPIMLAAAATILFFVASTVWFGSSENRSAFVDPTPGAFVFTLRETPDVVFRNGEGPTSKRLTIERGLRAVAFQLRAPRGSHEDQVWDVELSDANGNSWLAEGLSQEPMGEYTGLMFWIDPARLVPGEAEIRLHDAAGVAETVLYRFELEKH